MPSYTGAELADWCGGAWSPEVPDALEGVSNDSRTLQPGNLYFALVGERFDGNDFVQAAFDRGAGGAVVSSGAAGGSIERAARKGPLLVVDDTGAALRDIAVGYRKKTAPETVGVTGSVGKSTVKELAAEMISAVTPTARTQGNWNNEIGLPLSLLAMEEDCRVGVFEVGTNHPGETAPLCRMLEPSWGVVTNVGPVHIEFFDSVRAIADEKAWLFRMLPADGVAVVSLENEFFELFREAARCRLLTVSFGGDADYVCTGRDAVSNEVAIAEKSTGKTLRFTMPLPGLHNVANVLFAVAVAREHGVSHDQVVAAIDRYEPLPMRWEEQVVAGRQVMNDAYNANPVSMRAAFRAFDEQHLPGNKWLVLGGMLELGDRERDEHVALGAAVKDLDPAGLVVVGRLGELIADGAEGAGLDAERVFRCEDNSAAAMTLAANTRDGDAVLLKGSRGMHLEEVLEELTQAIGG